MDLILWHNPTNGTGGQNDDISIKAQRHSRLTIAKRQNCYSVTASLLVQ